MLPIRNGLLLDHMVLLLGIDGDQAEIPDPLVGPTRWPLVALRLPAAEGP